MLNLKHTLLLTLLLLTSVMSYADTAKTATLLSYSTISGMSTGDTKTVLISNPHAKNGYFMGHTGSEATSNGSGFSDEDAMQTAADGLVENSYFLWTLTKTSSGYTITVNGYNPSGTTDNTTVTWSTTTVTWTLGEVTSLGSTSDMTSNYVLTNLVRLSPSTISSTTYLNAQGAIGSMKFYTGTGEWSVWQIYEVTESESSSTDTETTANKNSDDGSSVSKSGYTLVFSTETSAASSYFPSSTGVTVASDAFTSSFTDQTTLENYWNYCTYGTSTWKCHMSNILAEQRQMQSYSDGTLCMKAGTVTSASDNSTSKFLTSGIETNKNYKYGIFEVKAKCNKKDLNFPAIWLMPEDHASDDEYTVPWPACGEIDVMEQIGNSSSSSGTVHTGIRYNPFGKTYTTTGNRTVSDAEYHIYTLVWTATSLTWYIDGTELWTYSKDTDLCEELQYQQFPYNKPYRIILDQAVYTKNTTVSGSFEMDVAYVRVFQRSSDTDPTCSFQTVTADKTYQITASTGKVLTAASTSSGATVSGATASSTDALQQWTVKGSAASGYYFHLNNTSYCMQNGTSSVTTAAEEWVTNQCNDGAQEAQTYYYDSSNRLYTFLSDNANIKYYLVLSSDGTLSTSTTASDGTAFTFTEVEATPSTSTAVTDLSDIDENKVYTLKSIKGAFLYYDSSTSYLMGSLATSYTAPTEDATDENQQFKFISTGTEGTYYLYSVGAGKYVTSSTESTAASNYGTFTDDKDWALTISSSSVATGDYLWYLQLGDYGVNSQSTSDNSPYGLVVNSWTTQDTGNTYCITEVGSTTTYTITCETPTGGSVSSDVATAAEGAIVTLSNTPSSGYTFTSYTVTPESGTTVTVNSDGTFTMPASNVTVSATFTKSSTTTYTITCSTPTGGTVSASATSAASGTTITLTNTPADGYTFSSYIVTDASGTSVTVSDDKFTMPASNVTVTGTFTKTVTQTTYTISSSTSDGSLSGGSSSGGPGQQTTYYNTWTSSTTSPTTLTLKSYSDSGCSTQTARISSSLGLYAKTSGGGGGPDQSSTSTSYFQLAVGTGYQIVSYNITYTSASTSVSASVTSGSDNSVGNQTATFSVTYSSSSSSRPSGGSGSYYITPSTFTVTVAPIQYTITYYGCDGATNPNPATYTIEDAITLAAPTKSGYTFTGWTNSSGTAVTSIAKGSTGNITLTANWTKPSYSISCKSTTGGTVTANPSAANENDGVTLTVTPSAGYELSTLSVKDASDNDVTVTSNTFTMPASNVTITATFTPIKYTITYNLNGGTAPAENPRTYTVETETFTLAEPAKEDYTFDGWTDADEITITQITKGTTGNLTLTANWTEITYTITCSTAENGTFTASPTTAAKGATVTITATPDEGYVLSSITVKDASDTEVEVSSDNTFTMPASAVTITAVFSEPTLALTDAAPTLVAGTYKAGNVTYTRSGSYIIDGNYSSFCLPFDFNVSDAPCFNKIYVPIKVAFYNTSTNLLQIFLVNQTGTIKAGTPFLARLTGNSINIKNAQEVTYDGTSTNPDEVELTVFNKNGSSSVLTSNETIDLYWGGTLTLTKAKTGMNTFNLNGSFGPSSFDLNPFRAYLIELTTNSVKINKFEATFMDDEPTGISDLIDTEQPQVDVYNINGLLIRKKVNAQQALDNLPQGLYIINGHKVLKK